MDTLIRATLVILAIVAVGCLLAAAGLAALYALGLMP